MKIIRMQVETYVTRCAPTMWEIRYFTDEGEHMSARTFVTRDEAQRHGERAIETQHAEFFGI